MLQIWVGGWVGGQIVIPMPEALSFAESRRQKAFFQTRYPLSPTLLALYNMLRDLLTQKCLKNVTDFRYPRACRWE
jgi:hypothetical protein